MDVARQMLLDDGYHGLTIGRVARATEYSRGTIYLHFTCKEEMIVALVLRGMERRRAMIERAAKFRGPSRERMQAIGEALDIFARLYPDDTRMLHIGNAEAVKQKVSGESLQALHDCLERSVAIATAIVHEAVAAGDLVLDPSIPPEVVTFGLYAITDAGHAPASSWAPPLELGIHDPLAAVVNGCEMLCDGYGWRPSSTEWDYAATRRRVRAEIFPDEAGKIAAG